MPHRIPDYNVVFADWNLISSIGAFVPFAAVIASLSFRPTVTWLSSRIFLATCWVMVEPPSGLRP